jgi:sugar phosphate isomerase/epimerase
VSHPFDSQAELMCLYWTSSGVFPGEGEVSRFSFRERVEAASKAGFRGIGIWHSDLEHTLEQMTLPEMKRILDANGMAYLELEFLTDWFVDGPERSTSDARRRCLLTASEGLGASHIKVGDFANTPCSMEQATEAFADLCEDAADHGARIAFEFMASAMIDNLDDALTLVDTVGAPNGGLAVDIAHVVGQGIPYSDVASIPLDVLFSVELNDGFLAGSPNHDASRPRAFCGEGEYDVQGFVRSARASGYRGPWAVEVFSKELSGLPLDELNARAFASTARVLEAASRP